MASVKIAYGTTANLTFTSLNSLAASSTFVAGAESTAVDNTTNLYTDYLLSGKFTGGTTGTQAGYIYVYVIGMLDDSTWPDVFDGTDSVETATSANVLTGFGRLAAVLPTDATNSRVYNFGPVSVAGLFGGSMPRKFVVFVTHSAQSSTNAWSSSGHQVTVTPVYYTVA